MKLEVLIISPQEELDRFRNEWRRELTRKESEAKLENEQLPAEMQSEATLEEKVFYNN